MQNMPEEELMEKEAALAAEVERLLPEFVNSCRNKADVVLIHQDAFAADYQDHECKSRSRLGPSMSDGPWLFIRTSRGGLRQRKLFS